MSGLAREPVSNQHVVLPKQSKITAVNGFPCSAFFECLYSKEANGFARFIFFCMCVCNEVNSLTGLLEPVLLYVNIHHEEFSLLVPPCRQQTPLRCIACAEIKQRRSQVELRHLYSRKIVANVAELSC